MARRILLSGIAALLVLSLAAVPATSPTTSAGSGWSRSDPLLSIQGNLVDVFVTGPLLTPLLVTGPTQIVVRTPPDIDTTVVLSGVGFGRGEVVSVEETSDLSVVGDRFEVEFSAYVPARRNIDIGIEAAPNVIGVLFPAKAYGKANEWVTVSMTLPKHY